MLCFVTKPSPSGSPFPSQKAGICLPAGQHWLVWAAGPAGRWLGGIRSLCGRAGPSAASETQPGTGASVRDDFGAAVVLLVQESILEELWEKPVLVCAEFCALSKLMPLFCLCKSLSKSDFHPR